jgi:hypothetical protein
MQQIIKRTKEYSLGILKAGPAIGMEGAGKIIWEHGRRNFSLREEGLLSIVCPGADGSGVSGVGIFNASLDRVKEIMDGDPAVRAGIFVYEIHPCRCFPGPVAGIKFHEILDTGTHQFFIVL